MCANKQPGQLQMKRAIPILLLMVGSYIIGFALVFSLYGSPENSGTTRKRGTLRDAGARQWPTPQASAEENLLAQTVESEDKPSEVPREEPLMA